MATLRDFIYLNTAMLDSYLGQLSGYLEDERAVSDSRKDVKGAQGGITVVSGSISSEATEETQSKRLLTPSAKFQTLFDTLSSTDQLRSLDLIDDEVWADLRRGEIIEAQVTLGVPQFIAQIQAVGEFSPLIELAQALGFAQLPDSQIAALSGFNALSGLLKGRSIPLICKAATSPVFKFVGDLSREYLPTAVNRLTGEATVFGKIQRIVPKGHSVEVFNLLPDLASIPNLSRQQRQALKSSKGKKPAASLQESVVGPIVILSVLAVYQ